MQGRRARRSAESWWARRSAAGSERRRQVRVPPRAEAATAATDARSDDIHYFADFPLRPSGQCRHSSINRLSTSTRTPLCPPPLSRALSRVRERKRESERESQSPLRAHRARPAHALTPHAALMAVARSHRDLHLRRPAAEWRWHRRRSCRGRDRRWRLCACRADTSSRTCCKMSKYHITRSTQTGAGVALIAQRSALAFSSISSCSSSGSLSATTAPPAPMRVLPSSPSITVRMTMLRSAAPHAEK